MQTLGNHLTIRGYEPFEVTSNDELEEANSKSGAVNWSLCKATTGDMHASVTIEWLAVPAPLVLA